MFTRLGMRVARVVIAAALIYTLLCTSLGVRP